MPLEQGIVSRSGSALDIWSKMFLLLNCVLGLDLTVGALGSANYYRLVTQNSETPYLAQAVMSVALGVPAAIAGVCAVLHLRMARRRWLAQWTLGMVPLAFEILRFVVEMPTPPN